MPRIASDGVDEGVDEAMSPDGVDHDFDLSLQFVNLVLEVGVDQRLRGFKIFENCAARISLLLQQAIRLVGGEGE